MDLGLKGKIALLTGASRGLGLATAKVLAQEGVNLALNSRDPDKLSQANEELAEFDVKVVLI
ncbi:MAG TPA: SDR family NAD(P)-dependent oxidoreductase, partial [Brevefilum fermentans]|nr:SDR family NAD(P)-dependent oxidoreductase [Brevefilum fermentans]